MTDPTTNGTPPDEPDPGDPTGCLVLVSLAVFVGMVVAVFVASLAWPG